MHDGVHRRKNAACGKESDVKRFPAHMSVALVEETGAAPASVADKLQMLRRVRSQDRFLRSLVDDKMLKR
jgi:hypothetical protein